LGDRNPGFGQGEGTVAQVWWCGVDEQAVDPGGPGVAQPGGHQQAYGWGEARTGGEGGRDDDAPLQGS
jgi:cellulase/cellobiase CelA1